MNNYNQSSNPLNKKNACLKVGPLMSGLYFKLSADIPLQYKGEKPIEIQHLPYFSIFMCILYVCCVRMFVCVWICMHTHLCASACGGPRLRVGTILNHSSTLCIEAGSLEARPGAHWHGYSY